ncbi:ATP-binding cassette domain-containing protein [Streptomyces hiroshimensis]|uniref:ABC transporter ATP-binding protein n=1 Tax=Streptomyces hiroshimensis TaxID=66424 RepID=A0ABQ2Y4R5_9ACTN|nr:ATP-binding cassette domain-containing protein [Streptomyces hiroshimensis]GGX61289.1 ABC transporter ATP-binding protein [Streptomyces hiroshimensis]
MRLTGVGRRYGLGGPWILRDVGLDIPEGSLLRVEGANGSGKSTLLRLLAGIDAPSTGRITGRPRTAYVPERFPAALPMTAGAYLTRLGRIHGLSRAAASRGALEWLERFGAAAYAGTPLSELSKGTSQKVAVAQGLMGTPGLLVLDEAWTGLERRSRALLDDEVRARVAAGARVVFVDHDPGRLAGEADAVLRVEGGGVLPLPAPSRNRGQAPGPPRRAERARPSVIVAEPPPGAVLPPDLPGTPEAEPAGDGAVRLTVAAPHSDALLRALLTAHPPWHIRSLTPAEAADPDAVSEASHP